MRKLFGCVTLGLACLTSPELFAEEDCSWDGCNWRGNWERGVLFGGGAIGFFDTNLRLGFGPINTAISLENDVGLPESSGSFRVGGYYRLGRRHRFDLEYYEFNRDATQRLSAGITVNGRFIGIERLVNTTFNLSVVKGDYQFNVWKTDRLELGLNLGIYGATIETQVEVPEEGVLEARDDFVPLPLIGVRATNALTDNFTVTTSLQAFAAEIEPWKGSIVEVWLGAEYNFWKHLGAGVAFDLVSGSLENDDPDDFNGRFTLDFNSVYFYGKLYF
jgi:hypothetical protein